MNTLILQESFDLDVRTDMVRGYLEAFDKHTGQIYKELARMPRNKQYRTTVDLFSVPEGVPGQFALDCACERVKGIFGASHTFLKPWELITCEIQRPDLQEDGLLITTEDFMLGDSFESFLSQEERVLSTTKNFGEHTIGPDVWFAARRLTHVDLGTFGSLLTNMMSRPVQGSA